MDYLCGKMSSPQEPERLFDVDFPCDSILDLLYIVIVEIVLLIVLKLCYVVLGHGSW